MTERVTQEEPWAKIPHWVVMHPELDASAIRVYAVLSKHANRARNSYPGLRKIAEEARCAKSTVQVSLDALEAAGAIEVTRTHIGKRPKVNQYHLPLNRRPIDGPIVGTRADLMYRSSVLDGPIIGTCDVPMIGTELEGSKELLNKKADSSVENPERLPGEKASDYIRRISSLIGTPSG